MFLDVSERSEKTVFDFILFSGGEGAGRLSAEGAFFVIAHGTEMTVC